MTKADIVEAVYHRLGGFSKREAAEIVELVFETLKETLATSEKVSPVPRMSAQPMSSGAVMTNHMANRSTIARATMDGESSGLRATERVTGALVPNAASTPTMPVIVPAMARLPKSWAPR